MSGFENKFRKFVVPNLTMWLIIGYAIGYIIQMVNDSFLYYLALDPYKIIHGQVWRLITWLLVPPNDNNLFWVVIMLFCYYSRGVSLERTWGKWGGSGSCPIDQPPGSNEEGSCVYGQYLF